MRKLIILSLLIVVNILGCSASSSKTLSQTEAEKLAIDAALKSCQIDSAKSLEPVVGESYLKNEKWHFFFRFDQILDYHCLLTLNAETGEVIKVKTVGELTVTEDPWENM